MAWRLPATRATWLNAGTITGTNSDGVQLNVNVSGSVDNSGTISGGFNGVGMNGGGSVTINNAATGIITGGLAAWRLPAQPV